MILRMCEHLSTIGLKKHGQRLTTLTITTPEIHPVLRGREDLPVGSSKNQSNLTGGKRKQIHSQQSQRMSPNQARDPNMPLSVKFENLNAAAPSQVTSNLPSRHR